MPAPRSKQCPVLLPGNPEAALAVQRGQLHFPVHRNILEHVHSSPFGSSGLSFPLLPASGKCPALCFLPSCVQCQQCFDAFNPGTLVIFLLPRTSLLGKRPSPHCHLGAELRRHLSCILVLLLVSELVGSSQSPDLWGETLQRKELHLK